MYARPIYTHHPRNFVLYPTARVGQTPSATPASMTSPGPMAQLPGPSPVPMDLPRAWAANTNATLPPGADGAIDAGGDRVKVVWPYLIAASIIGGAAFALGSGLVNKFFFGK
jgi:hypothetical protein